MIPVSEPQLGEKEMEYVAHAVRTGWISSSGPYIDQFESQWAAYCGRRHGIAVSNGTAALQLAVAALELEPGDEVIVPTFTIVSCAQAVTYNGGTPVLVDADPVTWCMDVEQIEARITPRTRAIMPVHIYGHPVDMDAIVRLADLYGIDIIEDAAEAHGAQYLSSRNTPDREWKRCGSMGTISAFSFYANKLITTGEGGMLLTDDDKLADRLRSMRNLCFGRTDRFRHEGLGHNFRLTNLQAGIGLAQMERIEQLIEKKRWIAQEYSKRLSRIPGLQLPAEREWARSVYWMYGILLLNEFEMDARQLGRALRKAGIDSRPFFLGMHEQPAFHEQGLFAGERYPVAEHLARRGLYLPSGVTLEAGQIEQVCEAVESVLAARSPHEVLI